MGYASQSAVLKREIEAKLASRIPAALSPQALQAPRLMSCCVSEIDSLLGGGFTNRRSDGVHRVSQLRSNFVGVLSSCRSNERFRLRLYRTWMTR